MRTLIKRGNTQDNNGLVLLPGELSIDTEKKALRIHDGLTPGGFEAVGVQAFVPPVGPGPKTLAVGTTDHGWYGEVASADLIDGTALAALVGLSAGTAQESTSGWLKFALNGKVLFVAKRPLRHTVSWNQLDQAGVVYGKEVTIGTDRFLVRLIRGANSDPTVGQTGYDMPLTHGSEWNRLMYHVHDGVHGNNSNTMASEGITVGDFAQYADADLFVRTGNGRLTICQERISTIDSVDRLYRGHNGISSSGAVNATQTPSIAYGWRPVLELIP